MQKKKFCLFWKNTVWLSSGASMNKKFLRIHPLGGLGEIGLNCQKWECQEGTFLMDCGLMFPDDSHYGIDAVIPSFESLINNKEKFLGVVLTHGHEDHIGALPWLLRIVKNIDIYGSAFTLALVKHKLTERGLLERANLILVETYDVITIGSLKFQAIPVCHSIPGGYAYFIESPIGKIAYTGDFKLDEFSEEYPLENTCALQSDLKDFAKDGIKLLLSDSTNIENRRHSASESMVREGLDKIFTQTKGRIIIALFASHIQRISTVFELAKKHGKHVIISGRSLATNINIANELGYLTSENYYVESDETITELSRENTIVLATGTQGEALSALTRISSGEHKRLALHEGDTVIMSSRTIPGNAKAVSRMINQMYKQGATVYNDDRFTIHATGHACHAELKTILELAKPEHFIPLHGEYRHLSQHAALAKQVGIEHCHLLEDGQPICFYGDNTFEIEKSEPVDFVLVDGKGVGDVGRLVLKERRVLSNEGILIVSIVLAEETNAVLSGPFVLSHGFVFEQQFNHYLQDAQCLVLEQLEMPDSKNRDKLPEMIRIALRRFFRDILGREPIIETIIHTV